MSKIKKYKSLFIIFAFLLVGGIIFSQYQNLHDWIQGYKVIWLSPSTRTIAVNDHGQALVFARKQNNLASSPFAYWQDSRLFNPHTQHSLSFEYDDKDYPNVLPLSINSKGFIVATTTNQLGLMESGKVLIMKGNALHEEVQPLSNELLQPVDINDSNAVVGYRFNKIGMGSSLSGGSTTKDYKAFYWSKTEGFVDLNEKLLAKQSQAKVVNNSGAVAGMFYRTNGWEPFYYKHNKIIYIPWKASLFRNVEVVDINNSGKVLLQEVVLVHPATGSGKAVAIWSKSSGIKFIKGSESFRIIDAKSINDLDQVLLEIEVDKKQKYMIYKNSVYTPLPDIRPKQNIQYQNLTNNGWLTGFVKLDDVEEYQGFVMKLIR